MRDIPSPLPVEMVPCATIFPLDAERETVLRARLIAEARSWIGTPYRQLGATKGVGVDCAMLLLRTAIEAGIIEEFDPRPYPPTWFLHRADERYIDWLALNACPVETPQPGDIVAFKVGRAFAHSALMSTPSTVVHAFAEEGRCTESELSHTLLTRAGRQGGQPRERRCFDLFARLRERAPHGAI